MRLISFLKSITPRLLISGVANLKRRYDLEMKYHDTKVNLRDRFWLWYKGFYSGHKDMYMLNRENINEYISKEAYQKLHPINGSYSKLIDSKAFLPILFKNATNVYIVIENGDIRYQKGIFNNNIYDSLVNSEYANFIIKPLSGSGGIGFSKIKKEGIINTINDKLQRKESFIIQEDIEQHNYSSSIYPGSANTIRIVLYRDTKSKLLKIAGAVHRFGTDSSAQVDNAGKGGLIVPIDIKNGVLGQGYIYTTHKNSGWHTHHPDTKKEIQGVEIPNWSKILDDILREYEDHEWFEYGGIDIVITNDNWVLVEINSLPALEFLQISTPLIKDNGITTFFKSKGLTI